jgi:hypothetical protein
LVKISREDPNAPKTNVVKETEVKEVEVTRYPKAVLETMSPEVLINMCGIMQIDISNIDKTTAAIVQAMEDK